MHFTDMCAGVEDSKYCQFVSVPKAVNCMDYSGWGNGANMVYESGLSGENIESIKFSYGIFSGGMESEYCGWCIGSKNNFGCANLKRKQYCILNKEYSKEEYERLKATIIEDMKKNRYTDSVGRVYYYGEFFPPEFSLFPYNDSNALKFVKKTKEEASAEGYTWQDKIETQYQKTVDGKDLPNSIEATSDEVLNEIVGCDSCSGFYRIATGEMALCRRLGIPLPSPCPKCREKERFSLINLPRTSHTTCGGCGKDIDTMHDPDLGRIVYCESCYQKEII